MKRLFARTANGYRPRRSDNLALTEPSRGTCRVCGNVVRCNLYMVLP